jgi:hypothetical protein
MYGFLFVNGVNVARLINVGWKKLTKAASQTLWERAGRIILNSHPRLHFRQAAGQRDALVGSLLCIVGLTQAITLRSLQAPLFNEGLQPRR